MGEGPLSEPAERERASALFFNHENRPWLVLKGYDFFWGITARPLVVHGKFCSQDFDMGIAYARMYNILYNPKEDLLDEYTITYITSRHPRAMFARLRKRGLKIIKDTPAPGIYQNEREMYSIQAVVLNEIADKESVYPFAIFLTSRDKGEKKAFLRLSKEKISHPDDENIDDLIEFAVKNDLVDQQEMEEVLKMLGRMAETQKAEYLKMVENSWLGKELMEKGMEKGRTEFARKLLVSGMNHNFVMEMTGLRPEEVEKLQKELQRETN